MTLYEFFYKNFVYPLYYEPAGYNVANTAVYALIFIAGIFGIYKLFKWKKISIDYRFFLGVSPYIVLGAMLRVEENLGLVNSIYFVTPFIYIWMAAFATAVVVFFHYMQRHSGVDWWKPTMATGISLCIIAATTLKVVAPIVAAQIIGITLVFFAAFLVGHRFFPQFFTPMNVFILTTALFDASSTFVGLRFLGYYEKHVLPNFFIGIFGPWVMFPLKLAVLLGALYVIDKSDEEENLKNWMKFAILIVTLGPGARNLFRMIGLV